MARRARTLLRGALQLAVLNNVLGTNPVRDVQSIRSKAAPKGASALTAEEVRDLLTTLRASEACQQRDLVDPITLLIATGLRRSELLALRWSDFDAGAGTIAVTGKLVRQRGVGLTRIDETKTAAGRRTIPLQSFAVTVLNDRRKRPYVGQQQVIFASSSGTLRDPENFNTAWRAVRDELGMPDVTSHSFQKTVATLIDDAGLSARIGADHLGHAKVSMTQDRYMSRGRVHNQVADLLDRAVAGHKRWFPMPLPPMISAAVAASVTAIVELGITQRTTEPASARRMTSPARAALRIVESPCRFIY